MSENTKEAKEQRCRELLEANPDLSMKEANVTIREEFGAGVAPPVFSRIKKDVLGEVGDGPDSPSEPESSEKGEERLAPLKDTKAKHPSESDDREDTDEDTDSRASSGSQDDPRHEDVAPVEIEEEIDPNLPKFPVHLEILAPMAQKVNLSGSFNRWRIDEHPMTHSGDGFWVFDGELPQGEWHYKFVLDGRIWYLDIHKRKVTDRTGVSHLIQVGDPTPKEEAISA